jgi:hypothetical protein
VTRGRKAALIAGLGVEAWGALHHLGRTWGSTSEERQRRLPGDELIECPRLITDHATTIASPAAEVWPWLAQMGWGRAGWYTYRWVDRLLFPANRASSDVIVPQWQALEIGERVLDGPPETGCFYVVELLEPNKMLVLRSWTHLPKSMRDAGATMEWTWGFYLEALDDSDTRFHFRVRGTLEPAILRTAYNALVVPADFIMGRSMCLGLRARAEGRHREALCPREHRV